MIWLVGVLGYKTEVARSFTKVTASDACLEMASFFQSLGYFNTGTLCLTCEDTCMPIFATIACIKKK